jgi:hypothetical protein
MSSDWAGDVQPGGMATRCGLSGFLDGRKGARSGLAAYGIGICDQQRRTLMTWPPLSNDEVVSGPIVFLPPIETE